VTLVVGLLGLTPLMVVLLLLQVAHKIEGIGAGSLIGFAPSLAVGYQVYLIPIIALAACALTYGRFAAEGELTAYFAAGGSPWKIMLPAILLGCLACIPAAYASFVAGPDAYAARDRLAREALVDVLQNPPPGSREINFPAASEDAPGIHLSYRAGREGSFESLVVMTSKGGKVTGVLSCGRGDLRYDEASGKLSLANAARASYITLDANGEVTGTPVRGDVRLLEESIPLYSKEGSFSVKADGVRMLMQRLSEDLAVPVAKQKGYIAEFVRRTSFAISPLFFALLGGLLGCLIRSRNRIVPLCVALILAAVLFFGFQIVSKAVALGPGWGSLGQLWPGMAVQVLPFTAVLGFFWWRLYRT
jgi:lipopolysaccharide export LptBFGC system permease protein LptF